MEYIATRKIFIQEEQTSVFSHYFDAVLSAFLLLCFFEVSLDMTYFRGSFGSAVWLHGLCTVLFFGALISRNRFTPWFRAQLIVAASVLCVLVYLTSGLTSLNRWVYPRLHLIHNVLMGVNYIFLSAGAVLILFRRVMEGQQTSASSGLGNSKWMNLHVNRRMAADAQNGVLIIFSLKNFRIINAVKGRDFGDKLIETAARLLRSLSTPTLKCAHLSGMEFCFWSEEKSLGEVSALIDDFKMRLAGETEKVCSDVTLYMNTASAAFPRDGASYNELFSRAHMALEKTLLSDENLHVSYTPDLEDGMKAEYSFNNLVRRAVENDEFYTVYQEKRDLAGEEVHSLEVLARYCCDENGPVSPADFIPVVHCLHLDYAFTMNMIRHVIADVPNLNRIYGYHIRVAVNIPPSVILYPEWAEQLRQMFYDANISPGKIVFEITEDLFIDAVDNVHAVLSDLRAMGIRISLDDFGTGYSSLAYLQDMSIDELKIDKSFIDHISTNEKSFTLVKAICDIAESNRVSVVAEGVETPDQLEKLKNTSCELVQGYLFSRPKSLADLSVEPEPVG